MVTYACVSDRCTIRPAAHTHTHTQTNSSQYGMGAVSGRTLPSPSTVRVVRCYLCVVRCSLPSRQISDYIVSCAPCWMPGLHVLSVLHALLEAELAFTYSVTYTFGLESRTCILSCALGQQTNSHTISYLVLLVQIESNQHSHVLSDVTWFGYDNCGGPLHQS